MDVDGDEEHRCAIGVQVAQQPAVVDVADDQFNRLEGEIDMRGVVHRQDDAGDDLHAEHHRKDRAERPPVVEVTRRRVGNEGRVDQSPNRETPFNPLQDWVLRVVVRWSAHDAILTKNEATQSGQIKKSADFGFWCRRRRSTAARPDWSARAPDGYGRRVVLRAVARTEEAVVVAFMGDRDTAEMGADADHDEPLVVAFLDAGLVALRIGQARRSEQRAPHRSASWCGS